jgi:hypothetical protein
VIACAIAFVPAAAVAQRADSDRSSPGPQSQASPNPPATPDSELTVYLMTMGPGDAVWERFGHNAIWVRDHALGTDVVYNWGMFDFNQPNFLGRFLTGDTRYWMAGFDLPSTVAAYSAGGRSVWAQELALTPAQRVRLRDFVEWNARPENMYYRYDYYRDNCSTRVRDAIDGVIGGRIREATARRMTETTYRSHTQRLTAGDFPVYTGIMLALGHPADRPISQWQEMFLPMEMREHLRSVRVPNEHGRLVPLVRAETQLVSAPRAPEPERPPQLVPLYLSIGLGVGVVIVALSRLTEKGSGAARLGLAAVVAAWSVLAGLLGTAALLAWTATQHVFMYRNENVLQFNPLPLVLALVVPVLLYRGWGAPAARLVSYTVAALAVAGLVLKVLPLFDQRNWEIIALAVPAHVAVALAVRRTAARRAVAASAARAAA